MAKKITAVVKLQLPAGKATPGPPVGSTLGPHGINIPGFTKEFNAKTADQAGLIIPVVITIYQDRSFTFILKTPPVPVLIKKSVQDRKRQRETQPRQGGKTHPRTGGRDRKVENARSERDFAGIGDEHGQRHGAQHGRYGRRVKKEYVGEFISRLPQGGLR